MATTSIPHRWKYDVFVSFRGEDIRKSFMDHMFNDFKQKGIHAFRDDRELPKGEYISPHLYKAIEESRFLIVIFSKDYASSSWCLRELVKILECKQMGKPKHEVQIIFYDVKPDVVRKQTGSYAEAFAKHDVSNRTEVDKWREALSNAANLSGWDLQDMTNGFESKFIDSISREILKTLYDGPLHVGENLVGIDIHFDKLDLSRFIGSDKVNMIGICGISGIGKTTLAKAIYNLMYVHFEGSCFCEDVQGVEKRQGLIQVQLHMIGKIMKIEDLKISSVGEGIMVIKKMMSSRPILLVLDDVDDHEQLEALAGSLTWFCPGSLIIFTGKDKQLLRSHGADEIYDMKFLDEDQSLQLFSSCAFKTKDSSRGFKEVADEVVKYVQGHPLALKVLGRFLYGKTVGQWVSELDQLKVHPNKEIQQVLRLSYDGLNLQQQNILLDIACSFIGVNSDFAASILDSCNLFADTNIQVLVDKSLITISTSNSLRMHDLIQAMAREIVSEESSTPGNRSRLWVNPSEIYNILSENQATEKVEILDIQQKKSNPKFDIDGKAFARMKNLRILKLPMDDAVNFSGRLDCLSNKLRLLYWHGCPFKLLPSDFNPENIVVIDLSYSNIKQLWTTPKCLRRLKVMKLKHCCNLTTTPDFSEITSLEELDLEGCVNLVTVHPSFGMLKRLVDLNMRDCRRAASFPSKVETDSLQVLNRSGCLNGSLKPFGLDAGLKSLVIWNQQHPQRSVSLTGLHMLKSLNFSYCNFTSFPESIGGLSCLERLYLEGNNFTSLPGSLSQLSNLQKLRLDGCKKLEVLPELPHSLETVKARGCTSLREVSGSLTRLSDLQKLILNGCKKLKVLPELPPSLREINASDCTSLRSVSLAGLHMLKSLNLSYCNLVQVPESIGGLSCLKDLDLGGNNLVQVHESIGGLSCLEHLYLEGNNFTSLPGSLSQLSSLKWLDVDGCKKLEVLPELPHSLETVKARGCTSLREVSGSLTQLSNLVELNVDGCKKLEVFPKLPHTLVTVNARGFPSLRPSNLQKLRLDGCKKLEVLPELPHSLETVKARGCTSLREVSGSLTLLSNLVELNVDGCKKLEVLPKLPHSLVTVKARGCTSLCSITGSNQIMSRRSTYLNNCPKLFENLAIDSRVSISETECRDSSVTSQGSTNRFSSFLCYAHNRCGLFRLPGIQNMYIQNDGCALFRCRNLDCSIENMDIIYDGNSIPNWFTNKSMGNQVKVVLPLDWSFSKLRGYGICVVFKRKKPSTSFGYIVKNFDGAYLGRCNPYYYWEYFKDKPIRTDEPDMIWLHYATSEIWEFEEAKNFVTFCFKDDEEFEVKEMGVRFVCDEDIEEADLSMFQDLPTLSEHGGVWCVFDEYGKIIWTW